MRVGIDEQLFGSRRLAKLASYFNDRKIAIGVLVLLWHESQNEEIEFATEDQIIDWTWCDHEPVPIVDYLVATKFIEPAGDGTYLIKGNRKHIETLQKIRAGAVKGGKATSAKNRQTKPPKSQGTGRLKAPKGAVYTILHYTILTPLKGGIAKSEAEKFVGIYDDIWRAAFDRPPILTNQTVDYLVQILNAVGGDLPRASAILGRYIGHDSTPKQIYKKSGWDLRFCLEDIQRFDLEAAAGYDLKAGRRI